MKPSSLQRAGPSNWPVDNPPKSLTASNMINLKLVLRQSILDWDMSPDVWKCRSRVTDQGVDERLQMSRAANQWADVISTNKGWH
ncbi:hypothetical protein WJX79_006081 [Trebouxia sp. C0005]